jgi:hypothetical protein
MNRIVIAVLWLGVATTGADARQTQVNAGAKQSMDMVVTRWVVDAKGQPIGPPADVLRYHLARIRTDKGWRTTLIVNAAKEEPRAATDPFGAGRLEFDENGGFALFDKDGREVAIPRALRPPVGLTFDGDLSGWAPDGSKETARSTRVSQAEARYGASTGKVRGFPRYIKQTDDTLEELLLDATSGLPVQHSVVKAGVLRGQVTFDYSEQPGRGLIRRAMRSETMLNDEGHRAVTTTEFTNVVIEHEK